MSTLKNSSKFRSSKNDVHRDFKKFIKDDLVNIRKIRNYCTSNPRIDSWMRSLINKHPFQDIVIVLYFFFAVGLVDIGKKHFWVVVTNLSFAFLVRRIIEAKRPVEYDRTMQPITDRNADSFGFPSLESHMSVVILGHFCLFYNFVLVFPFAVVVTFVIGVSRVYSRSRFPHQIVGSWITGLIGLYVATHCCTIFGFHMMKKTKHICCVLAIVFMFLCHFALCAENNDSQVFGIEKKEFVRVISGIIDSGASGNDDINRENEDNVAEDDYVEHSHRKSMAFKGDLREAAVQSRKGVQNKRDSLYFLQRSMQQREGTATFDNGQDADRQGYFAKGPSFSPRSQQQQRYGNTARYRGRGDVSSDDEYRHL